MIFLSLQGLSIRVNSDDSASCAGVLVSDRGAVRESRAGRLVCSDRRVRAGRANRPSLAVLAAGAAVTPAVLGVLGVLGVRAALAVLAAVVFLLLAGGAAILLLQAADRAVTKWRSPIRGRTVPSPNARNQPVGRGSPPGSRSAGRSWTTDSSAGNGDSTSPDGGGARSRRMDG